MQRNGQCYRNVEQQHGMQDVTSRGVCSRVTWKERAHLAEPRNRDDIEFVSTIAKYVHELSLGHVNELNSVSK